MQQRPLAAQLDHLSPKGIFRWEGRSRRDPWPTDGLTADFIPELLMQESNQTLIQEPKELQDEGAASSLKHHFLIIHL